MPEIRRCRRSGLLLVVNQQESHYRFVSGFHRDDVPFFFDSRVTAGLYQRSPTEERPNEVIGHRTQQFPRFHRDGPVLDEDTLFAGMQRY